MLPRVRGAYSLVVLDERRVIGVRDPHGFRPLVLGRLPRAPRPGGPDDGLWSDDDASAGWCLSSETAALDIVGAEYVRDVEPGEIVVLEQGQAPRSVRYAAATPALCVFELIYFARPDSYMEGRNLYEVRRRMGDAAGASSIRSRPTSSCRCPTPARRRPPGSPRRRAMPYREGMYRNRYAGRTFIQPSQGLRHRGVTIKLNPLREVVRREEAHRRRRLDRARHDHEADRRAAAQGRRDRGPRPDQRPADLPPVLLRHRHLRSRPS